MRVEYYKDYSYHLGRDMEFKVYGESGTPCIFIPCQNGRFYDFENYGMIPHVQWMIEAGLLQIFSIDTVDAESLSAEWKNPRDRICCQEAYFDYVVNEMAGRVRQLNSNGAANGIMAMGFSMGAFHAANFYFRRPDIFTKALCLSGVYRMGDIIFGYMDDLVYMNSPIDFLWNMTFDHPYMDLYAKNNLIVCNGRGPWEDLMQKSTGELEEVLQAKHIPAWIDHWGTDVAHDWPWWKKQVEYFMPKLLEIE